VLVDNCVVLARQAGGRSAMALRQALTAGLSHLA